MPDDTSTLDARQRFEFGKNWSLFLKVITEDRIAEAEQSLREMLEVEDLNGKRFLDIGSGSGLFSLAARRLGARVHSFDCDPHSVESTNALKRRFFPEDGDWILETGSVLDAIYMKSLGQFDVVYAWGVLHHTGEMWTALQRVQLPLAENGLLYVAIYNRQPFLSAYWLTIKRLYNWVSRPGKLLMEWGFYCFYSGILCVADGIRWRNPTDRHRGRNHRGMSMYRDIADWIGGYPFEVAAPEEIFRFYRDQGYVLKDMKTCAGKHGCNEFVFQKVPTS